MTEQFECLSGVNQSINVSCLGTSDSKCPVAKTLGTRDDKVSISGEWHRWKEL